MIYGVLNVIIILGQKLDTYMRNICKYNCNARLLVISVYAKDCRITFDRRTHFNLHLV